MNAHRSKTDPLNPCHVVGSKKPITNFGGFHKFAIECTPNTSAPPSLRKHSRSSSTSEQDKLPNRRTALSARHNNACDPSKPLNPRNYGRRQQPFRRASGPSS